MKHLLLLFTVIFLNISVKAQSELSQIKNTLSNYINGTSYNTPELIKKAFYKDANLYLNNKQNKLFIVSANTYANWYNTTNQGKFTGRIGNILNVDYTNGIASAKVEIIFPKKNMRYIDLFLLKKINNQWKIISKTASIDKSEFSKTINDNKILFIVSNASFHGTSKLPTGNSFSEIVNAYDTFKKAGYSIDFVSPKGGSVPLAYINTSDELVKKYVYDIDFMYALKHTKTPQQITAKNYKAVHYIGGGAAMYGVPENTEIQKIAMEIYEEYNGIISSVCHGTAGIVNLKTKDGNYVYKNKVVNGYPDSFERQDAEYYKQFPFKIQKLIEKRGGIFEFSPRNVSHVAVDGNLITGQNYLSSKDVALTIIKALNNRKAKIE